MQSHMQDHESPIKLALSPTTLEDAGIYVYTLTSVQNVCIACCDDLRLIHTYISMNKRSYVFLSMLLCSCCFLFELQAALGT